jgi:hypothetical protein
VKRAIVSFAVTAVAAGGLLAAGAPASAVPPPCGFYEVGSAFSHSDMYNHCGDGPVLVTMVGFGINNQYTACLTPGIHDLNRHFNANVVNAYSEGEPCIEPDEPWG